MARLFCWGIVVGSSHRNIFKADEVWIICRPVIIGPGLIWVPQFVQFSAVATFARLISHLLRLPAGRSQRI